MFRFFRLFMESSIRLLYSRRDLLLENLALRQQLAVFKSKNGRPRLAASDKLFWVAARRLWAGWKKALMVVTPERLSARKANRRVGVGALFPCDDLHQPAGRASSRG